MPIMNLDDDVDDDDDDDDEFDEGDGDEEDEDEDPDADGETWQVSANFRRSRLTLNSSLRLTSGNDLPRLARTLAAQQAGPTQLVRRPGGFGFVGRRP
jgi:hypothetical protein